MSSPIHIFADGLILNSVDDFWLTFFISIMANLSTLLCSMWYTNSKVKRTYKNKFNMILSDLEYCYSSMNRTLANILNHINDTARDEAGGRMPDILFLKFIDNNVLQTGVTFDLYPKKIGPLLIRGIYATTKDTFLDIAHTMDVTLREDLFRCYEVVDNFNDLFGSKKFSCSKDTAPDLVKQLASDAWIFYKKLSRHTKIKMVADETYMSERSHPTFSERAIKPKETK